MEYKKVSTVLGTFCLSFLYLLNSCHDTSNKPVIVEYHPIYVRSVGLFNLRCNSSEFSIETNTRNTP